ncbi:MAG: hypothetical protein RBT03_04280 [Kiritimatiellia bacterium]|nr:hypothetical protein [Kiritimatiellia bacterium]
MTPLPPDPPPNNGPSSPFRFFPPRNRDSAFEGRDPHESVKTDCMGHQFPRPWHIAAVLFVCALVVNLASMSWTAFPGLPTRALLQHLKLEPAPAVLNLFWGWGVRGADRVPGLTTTAWMGLVSAVCGALSVALLSWLMVRVGYVIRNEPGSASFLREAQARRLSGLVSGLYLLCTIPFWVASTRSLPGTFHVLWLLLTACVFSQYQLWGRRKHLFFLGFLYGAGITESATFLVFLPLAVFLVAREMFRWHAITDWRRQVAIWGGFLLGLVLYGFHAVVLFRHGLPSHAFASPWAALLQIWQSQMALVLQVRHSAGFFVVMFFCLGPWLTIFVMSRRSPWFYEWGQIVVRLIFIGGLLAVLYNASFSPWHLMGMSYLLLTPYVLMAVGMGYMAGEFWILGERHHLLDFRRRKRVLRRLSSSFALGVLPLAILAGGVRNWSEADGRHGAAIQRAAEEVLDRLDHPTVLLAAGVLDDALRIVIRERWSPVVLISLPRTRSPLYLQQLAKRVTAPSLAEPLNRGEFDLFLENLLIEEGGLANTAILDLPDHFREFGYLLPDGFVYLIALDPPQTDDWAAHLEAQRSFWAQMGHVADTLPPKQNPAYPYLQYLCLMASRVANNFGVMLMEADQADSAQEAFSAARRMFPKNISVLLNLLSTTPPSEDSTLTGLEEDIAAFVADMNGEQWSLATQFGHVWHPRQWLERGWVWALSGTPSVEPASRYAPPSLMREDSQQVQLFDKAYLQWGSAPPDESTLRNTLVHDPRHTEALVNLARLALRRRDFEVADAYFGEAMRLGHPEEALLFDRAMERVLRGDIEDAAVRLDNLSHFTFGDVRVWCALALITKPNDSRNEKALRTLSKHPGINARTHEVLGSLYMARGQWDMALAELEKAVSLGEAKAHAWQLLLTVATEMQNSRLVQIAQRALMAQGGARYLQFQETGLAHYAKGDLAAAEQAFREGLQQQRHHTLLNNLAHIIQERGGNLQEALAMVNEAIRRQPGIPSILNTRAQILMAMDRLADARQDVVTALKREGQNMDPLLDLALRYRQQGDQEQVQKLVGMADQFADRLDAIQGERLKALKASLAADEQRD